MSISNNALIFYHAYTIESKKKSVYFTDFSIKTSFPLEYRDRFERLLGYDGELTTWRPDGMKVVQTYKNGVANGWQKNYNSQGALMGEIMMKNGRATGEFRAYDSRGNIVQEGTHEDNVVSTVKGMSSPRPEPNEVSPNDNGGIMIKEVNE